MIKLTLKSMFYHIHLGILRTMTLFTEIIGIHHYLIVAKPNVYYALLNISLTQIDPFRS